MSGTWISFFDSDIDIVIEAYNGWFESESEDIVLAIHDDLGLEEQVEVWMLNSNIPFEYKIDYHPVTNIRSCKISIKRKTLEDRKMSTTIEQLKKQAIVQLEALQKVSADLEALKTKLSGVSLESLIEAYIQTEVKSIDAYAKRNKIDFKVDTKELVKLIKLPDPNGGKQPSQILPFLPREGATLEDQSWTEWKVVDGEWTDTWYNSWQSSSNNC